MTLRPNPWIVTSRPRPEARLRLYCFAFAGGSASVFNNWHLALPEEVEVCAVQYPGRESRWKDPVFSNAAELAQGICLGILPQLAEKSFAFFGHSLGALMAFEVTRLLHSRGAPEPAHLFLSSRRAPQFKATPPVLNSLSDDEFVFQLGALNGTPPEVLQNQELMSLLLPMLRADFTLDETFELEPGPPLQQNFSIFGAEADLKVPQSQLEAWAEYTSGTSTLTIFPGGHFYLKDPASGIFQAVNLELTRLVNGG